MRIVGEWFRCEDGFIRPTLNLSAHDRSGERRRERFLIDSGSDRTVLSAYFLRRLRIAGEPAPADLGLSGIGGGAAFVVVRTVLELTRDDGVPATVRGEFAAFTDPRATDLSILGRDVLDQFRLIVSRPDDEVLLLAGNHYYRIGRI
jgi:hypothetical protein